MKKYYLNPIGLISIAFSIIALSSFYPGVMTWDSMDQLRQARAASYTDWQPPAMAFLWSLLTQIIDGPGGMLIFQFTLLWATALILYKWCIKEGYRFGVCFLILPILPWVMNFQFAIWKDVNMAYAWGLAIAICLYFKNHDKFPKVAATLVLTLFIFGALVRTNSLSGTIFLFPFLCATIFKTKSIKSTVMLMILSCVVVISAHLSVVALLGAQKANSVSYVMFDDVVALKLKGVDIPTSFLSSQDMMTIEHCEYLDVHKIGAAFCLSDEKFASITKEHYQELKTAWIGSVPKNFSTYISFRTDAFLNLIRSPSLPPYYYSEFHVINSPFKVGSGFRQPSTTEILVEQYVETSSKLFPGLYKPYFWILISFGLTLYFWLKSNLRPYALWFLPMSGLSYAISYLPITPASDFRYVYWLCYVTTLSIVIMINILSEKKASDTTSTTHNTANPPNP